ncbi:DUF58 domain-containing protein [Methanoregula sp.]|uniref:DUF58 domain-containing protein n=1 Tax=Methanoregula sp. TaxID=2052170 RepID=UPI00356458E8
MRRCAQGLALVLILVFTCAYILDDMALLLAGGTLLCALSGQYLLFDHRFRKVVTSIQVQRTPERSQVRKGTTLRVSTTVSVTVPHPMSVKITEQLPPQVVIQDGNTEADAGPDPAPQTCQFRYRITPVVHGNVQFPGISLSVRNAFFENSIDLFSEAFSGPGLVIQPVGFFEPSSRRSSAESREVEKLKVVSGFGIRALREYYAGDDFRRIDWKLSAKHNKLFVREYSGMVTMPPLLIIDLPWRGAPYPEHDLNRMVSAVTGMAEHSIRSFQYVSILIISGPNILHFTPQEKDLQQGIAVLREWMHPVERTVHQYRIPDRADIRGAVRHLEMVIIEGKNSRVNAFSDSLRKKYISMLAHMQVPAFAGQVARTLASIEIDEIYLFTLGCGDSSHIRQVIRQAKIAQMVIHTRIPDARVHIINPDSIYKGADTLETFT